MRRALVLATLVVLALVAAFLWTRGGAGTDPTAQLARPATEAAETLPVDLVAPTDRASGADTADSQPHAVPSAASAALDPQLAAGESPATSLEHTGEPTQALRGRVVDRETGAPIAGARVGPSRRWLDVAPDDEQLTDEYGRFAFGGLRAADKLSVFARDYAPAWTPIGPGHATYHDAVEIALSRAATARITVLDAGETPIAEAEVALSTGKEWFARPEGAFADSPLWSGAVRHLAVTDATGVAVFEGLLPDAPWDGTVARGGERLLRTQTPLRFEPGRTRAIEWRVGGGCSIHGVALERDGTPVADLEIWLEDAAGWPLPKLFDPQLEGERRVTRADAAGRFTFAHVRPGAWRLGPAAADHGGQHTVGPREVAPHGVIVDVPDDVPRLDVVVRVARGLSIEGRVLDPSGAPVELARVQFRRTADGLLGALEVEDGSGFVLGPIEDGEYELRAYPSWEHAASAPVVVRAGARDVALRLRPGASIRGIVVDAEGNARPDAEVRVSARGDRDRQLELAGVDAAGRFELSGLEEGLHDVVASAPGALFGLVRGVDARPGTTPDVRVELVAGGHVRVHFVGPWPAAAMRVLAGDVTVLDVALARGAETVHAVPVGALVARIRDLAGGAEVELPFVIGAGEFRTITFAGSWR